MSTKIPLASTHPGRTALLHPVTSCCLGEILSFPSWTIIEFQSNRITSEMTGNRLKPYLVTISSRIFAVTLFILALPLTIAAMLIMLVTGTAAMAFLRHRLRTLHRDHSANGGSGDLHYSNDDNNQKPPIEGSYSVVDK